MKNASISENVRAKMMVRLTGRVNWAAAPPMKSHGENAIIVVKTAKKTGLITSCVPKIAASTPSRSPASTSL